MTFDAILTRFKRAERLRVVTLKRHSRLKSRETALLAWEALRRFASAQDALQDAEDACQREYRARMLAEYHN